MVTITTDQKVGFHVTALTALGNPAVLDAPPVWETSDSAVVQLIVSTDGFDVSVVSVGVGTAQVTVSGVSFGLPVPPAVEEVVVTAAPAAQLVITVGVPENK